MTYALDTNIISYILQDREHIQKRVRETLLNGDDLIIPPIAYYEVRERFIVQRRPQEERRV
ncbi:hypothetical protein FACS1894187_15220 [Synergistales bacterium]|nr:hypothetical protein FACS1894187_15220 [Synergistales bacterium]